MPQDQRILVEIGWVADDALLVKEIDRAARVGKVVLFQDGERRGTVVRTLGKDGEGGDGGWIDHVSLVAEISAGAEMLQGQNIIPVGGPIQGYLDVVPNEGYDHIAFYSPINATTPIWITSGDWEVTQISAVASDRNLVCVSSVIFRTSLIWFL